MILSIGEILFDIFPDYKRLGGAPFNFAFHLKKLGMPVRFISRVGKDAEGDEIAGMIERYGFGLDNIQTDAQHATGTVLVETDDKGVPNFNILENTAYDHLDYTNAVKTMLSGTVDLIYIGSLAQRSPKGFETIQRILNDKRPHTRILYDVNLRPDCYKDAIIKESLKHTHVLKLNDEESDIIKKMFGFRKNSRKFVEFLFTEFPLEMLALTKGAQGSELYTKDLHIHHKSRQLKNITDTVGAGDGFAAILAIGYLRRWPMDTILATATGFAEKICRIEGAIPDNPNFYKDFKKIIQR